jgi:uncharacterized membrane protein
MFADPPLTKRQIGWLFVLAGAGLGLLAVSADLLKTGRFEGLGPLQQQALGAGVLLLLFGLSLLPLGQRPA